MPRSLRAALLIASVQVIAAVGGGFFDGHAF
jgi:hypothetical protein